MTIIGHLDMDAFFASVEELKNPALKGKPVVVGADPRSGRGRGVVATANYPAREYGIHSAMPISQAWRLSETARWRGQPPVVFCRGYREEYGQISDRIMALLESHVDRIQPVSIDEAYFDVSRTVSLWSEARTFGQKMKAMILRQESLVASIGFGPNKMVAKVASDVDKPDGLKVVPPEQVESFLDPLSVRVIPGIGLKTELKLQRLGVTKVFHLKHFSRDDLIELFGKWGDVLYSKVRGQYDSPLHGPTTPLSLGEQRTFSYDSLHFSYLYKTLQALTEDVWQRFIRQGFQSFRTVIVVVRFADFETFTRSRTFSENRRSVDDLLFIALVLLSPFLDSRANPQRKLIRMLGIRMEKLNRSV